MTRHLRLHAALVMMALLSLSAGSIGAADQGSGGAPGRPSLPPPPDPSKTGPYTPSLIGWNDLETWSKPVGSDQDMERGLGLQLTGTRGKVLIGFSAVQNRYRPNVSPRDVTVTLIPGYDPTKVHWSSLRFEATGLKGKKDSIDVSSRVVTYPHGPFGPGDSPIKGTVTLSAEQFAIVAGAEELAGIGLGTPFTVRPDQLKALRKFGQTIGLIRP